MKRILIPAVATLVAVASLIAIAGWNRSRDPLVALTLTERELAPPYNVASDDRLALQLHFRFEPREDALDARNWLPEDRLRALGFVLDDERELPRIAWVVFEYDGASWQEVARRQQLLTPRDRFPGAGGPSRLVPVDAALDVEPLRVRYPSGYLILRAVIALARQRPARGEGILYGRIRALYPPTVTVPRHLEDRLAGLDRQPLIIDNTGDQPRDSPRYEVDLAVGPLGIPYIRDLRRLPVQ